MRTEIPKDPNTQVPKIRWRTAHLGLWVFGYWGIFVLVGCGPNNPTCYPVTGTITVDGQPLTTGTITFYPEQGRSSLGKIQPNGTYSLTAFEAGDGALPGQHTVTIKATSVSGPAAPSSFEEEMAQAQGGSTAAPPGQATVTWLVPEVYSQRNLTPLTATVKEESNLIDFTIP